MKLLLLSPLVAGFATVGTIGRYPGYTGPLNITGSVAISVYDADYDYDPSDDGFTFELQLTGAKPDVNHGVHIHSGVSCDVASAVGGHFWKPFRETDPWNNVFVIPDENGTVTSGFNLFFGYEQKEVIGHALVIHDDAGTRVACGIIAEQGSNKVPNYKTATLEKYPGYSGTLNSTGTIEVWDLADGSQVVNFRLKGLDEETIGGLHIHAGKTCATSGAHFWTPANETDPWNSVSTVYISNQLGNAEGSFVVDSGYLLADNEHHAVVIHDENNTRIACGLLGGAEPTPATPTPATTSVDCPNAALQVVFTACKVYDFTGSTCSQACATSLTALVAAFAAQNVTTLADAQGCVDTVNSTTPWVNGDVASLKQDLKLDGSAICTVSTTTNGVAAVGASVLAVLLPLFFL